MRAAVVITCIALASLAGEGCEQNEGRPGVQELISATDLGIAMNIAIPPTVRVLRYQKWQGIDESIQAMLEMSESEWQAFASGLDIKDEDLTPEDVVYLLGSDGDWWDPGSVPGLVGIQIVLPNLEALNIGVDRRDPSRTVVYLAWHQT